MRYEIDLDNAVRIYQDGETVPFLFQPDYPDGTPWADRADAEAWANAKIAELGDINAPASKNSPTDLPQPQQRKVLEGERQAKIALYQKMGLTVAEAETLV